MTKKSRSARTVLDDFYSDTTNNGIDLLQIMQWKNGDSLIVQQGGTCWVDPHEFIISDIQKPMLTRDIKSASLLEIIDNVFILVNEKNEKLTMTISMPKPMCVGYEIFKDWKYYFSNKTETIATNTCSDEYQKMYSEFRDAFFDAHPDKLI